MAKRGRRPLPHPQGKITKLSLIVEADGRPQYVLAHLFGVPAPRLSEFIHGKRSIPVHTIYRMCTELRCNPEDLVGWAEELRSSDSRLQTG